MTKKIQIKRVKKSFKILTYLNKVICESSNGRSAVFDGRFISSLGIYFLFEKIHERRKKRSKRVLFHTEVRKEGCYGKKASFLKKILLSKDVPLIHYEKIFFENHQMRNTFSDWSLVRSLLHKIFRCVLTQQACIVRSYLRQVNFKHQISHLHQDKELECEQNDLKRISTEQERAHEYSSKLQRNYRTTPKI